MHWQLTASSITYFLSGIVTLVAAWINWRFRRDPGVRSLAIALILVTLWSFIGGVELAQVEPTWKIVWVYLESVVSDLFVFFLFLFILQYYRHGHWLTPPRVFLLFVPVVLSTLLMVTNSWHHWYWTGIEAGPAGSNMLYYRHGLAYYLSISYYILLELLVALILYRHAVGSKGWNRLRTILMGTSFLLPLLTFMCYVLWSDQIFGLNLMPLGFSIWGLMMSGIVFEDLQRQISRHTTQLEETVVALEAEVENRKNLEQTLLNAQDSLAARLVAQSNNLAGLYDLILMAGQSLGREVLLEQSLRKIRALSGSYVICFYQVKQGALLLEAYHGATPDMLQLLQHLPLDWVAFDSDVQAIVNVSDQPNLPAAISGAGFEACMCKWVCSLDRVWGMLGAFWPSPRSFTVEDIILFSALTDELGVILENSRLRDIAAQNAISDERNRLARDLHDSVTQSLHSLVLSAETAELLLRQSELERLQAVLIHVVASARQALKEMRLLLYELRLAPSSDTDLLEVLKTRLDAVERRAGIDAHLVVEDGATGWPVEWEKELYPMAVEALNNALKHAHASRVEIRFCKQQRHFKINVSDNGNGFDPQGESGRSGGMGLANMSERVKRLGGRLEIQSEVGRGTCVSFLLDTPVNETAYAPGGTRRITQR